MIAIGASLGGPESINTLTKSLFCETPPILILLQLKHNLIGIFCKRSQSFIHLKAIEITCKVHIGSNSIFIASGDHPIIVSKKGDIFSQNLAK